MGEPEGLPPDADRAGLDGDGTMPRWVKVFGIVAAVLVVVFVILHLAGLGPTGHGP